MAHLLLSAPQVGSTNTYDMDVLSLHRVHSEDEHANIYRPVGGAEEEELAPRLLEQRHLVGCRQSQEELIEAHALDGREQDLRSDLLEKMCDVKRW